ncbi:hypothetical protein RhiirA1_538939 [Rhizophagus irregularis]|uniref:Uncharacterized protein n=1 Tax=Rhizophagus irregularis TaxID=588596 RepID=A0A2I1ER10_9GLOM|nr:hypothetical protein RhiirA1_538939 [Rhizophagus irregularis]PKY24544.1 hypothetical protein RhiirB3_527297 [Rhizophagus irregularis]CAB4488193.1 unnamed protein product [Rhizophagus irregularis]CAB5377241.1 unnamed protein product [Rhizophagus irregularis]
MYWSRSLLLYKTSLLISLFTTFVLSCSPEVNNGDVFSINQSNTNTRLQLNPRDANPGTTIYTVNSNIIKPLSYEIFLLTQPIPGFYEFRPFEDFYRTLVIEMESSVLFMNYFVLNHNANSDNQRFSIDCAKCNIQSNSTDWTIYHTSCSITNKSSNLCMNSEGPNNTLARSSCEYATKWDLWGRASIDSACSSSTGSACSCPTDSAVLSPTDSAGSSCSTPMINTVPNNVQISKGGFVATVLGSILGTGLITLATSYWFIQRKRIYPGHALNT